jgi:hypothetical protein
MGAGISKKREKRTEDATPQEYTFSVTFIGEQGVGKTSLLSSMSKELRFSAEPARLESRKLFIDFAGVKVSLILWDPSMSFLVRFSCYLLLAITFIFIFVFVVPCLIPSRSWACYQDVY